MQPDEFQNSPSGRVIHHPNGYWAFVPNPLPPTLSWTPEIVIQLSRADRALGELAGLGRSLPNPHLLVRPFVRREAVLSSRIEGTRASLSDLYAYETEQPALFDDAPDVQEVHNYVLALEYGLERLATLPVSLRLIRELHERLMEGTRGEKLTPGEFRRSPNWIGAPGSTLQTATYVPPPPEEMGEALSALETYLHTPSEMPPLVRLGLVHYQFEAIHPFLDGNGRVGRLLMSLLLCGWGLLPQPLLYLSAYFEANRRAYYDGLLAVSQHGAWDAWLVYFLRGVETQAYEAVIRLKRLHDLREQWRDTFQKVQGAARLLTVVDLLFATPLLTIKQVANALNVKFPPAQRYLTRLEEAGLVREITGRARNRVYRADAIFAAIDEPL